MEAFFGFLIITLVIVLVLFVPALIELKRPKDNGPRKIAGFQTAPFLRVEKEAEPCMSSKTVIAPVMVFESLFDMESSSSLS